MGQIEDFRIYVVLVDEGSVTRAAKKLNIAKSAVSRRLSLLEDRFATKLIERGLGTWKITETGEELYQRAAQVVGQVEEINADFISTSADISGPLSVSVPRDFGLGYLKESLTAFKTKYPEIILAVDFDDRVVDLDRENYDFVIRITGSQENNTCANQIGTMKHIVCASPNYLEINSPPRCLEDLQSHQLLHFGTARRATWNFIGEKNRGKKRERRLDFRPYLNSNSGLFLLDATVNGLGISRLPDFIVKQAIEEKKLTPILVDLDMPRWGIFLIHSERRAMNKRMRVFFEEMKSACVPMVRPD